MNTAAVSYTWERGLPLRVMNLQGVTNRIAAARRRDAQRVKELLATLMLSDLYWCCPVGQRVEIVVGILAKGETV